MRVAATALFLLITGCTSIGTQSVSPEEVEQAVHESALSRGRVSDTTARLLRLTLLDELATEAPERVMRSLVVVHGRGDGPWESTEPVTAAAEIAILEGRRLETSDPLAAAGYFLAAAELAKISALKAVRGEVSALDPQARFAAELYNFSVRRLVPLLQGPLAAGKSPDPLVLEGPLGRYRIELAGDRDAWDPDRFVLKPADAIAIRGLENRHRSAGMGAPLVVTLSEVPERLLPKNGLLLSYQDFYGVTGTVLFETGDDAVLTASDRYHRVKVELHDPLTSLSIEMDGLTIPLEADFSAPLAVLNEVAEPRAAAAAATFRAENYTDEVGLLLFEPYRKDKIPVVLVHGLQSNSITWIKMANGLRADPKLREHYQIWAFNYPTGLPFTLSGALLRQSLTVAIDRLDPDRENPHLDRMVIVGHSMGGLVSRWQVTESNDRLWHALSDRELDTFDAAPEDLKLLRETLFLEPFPGISRAIFMATPHRGSRLASGTLGRWASSLVKIPADLAEHYDRLIAIGAVPLEADASSGALNSIDSLHPDNPIFDVLLTLPPQVPFHSVFADLSIGAPDVITDGIVEGWSAKLAGAESEKTVSSTHGVHQHPEGIAEVRRILKAHLKPSP